MGEKSFWDLPIETRDKWFSSLAHVYMMATLNDDEKKQAEMMMENTIEEYNRRALYAILY